MARTRIGFRLSESQKQRWEERAEESRYADNLSDFIKHSVENQIENGSGDSGAEPRGEPSGEVLDRIQEVKNQVEGLENTVSESLDAIHGQEGIDPDLPPEVYSALPKGEENARTAEEIAETAHLEEPQVRFALGNLVRNMGSVKRTPEEPPGANEQVRWFTVE